jgi:putative ABC transport system permease protein
MSACSGPQETAAPQLYTSYLQHPQGMITMLTRASDNTANAATLFAGLRGAVHDVDRDLPVSQMRTMTNVVAGAISRQRFNMLMISLFAVAALRLASIGLYGVMSYLVAQRTREIGIRVALGGQPGDVRRLVVRESMAISAIGIAVGTGITLAVSSVLAKLLFGISATDPLTYGTIAALLLAVASAATYGPARRATRVDPILALRE